MITVIKTTLSNKEIAIKLGKELLDLRLIACSNISPITSQYIWKGKYHEDKEYALTLKTNELRKKDVIKHLQKNHPYEIPFISTEEHVINNAYQNWMDAFVQ